MVNSSTTEKGKLLERLVAMLHEGPGVTVQQRVKLPTRYNPKHKREVDVLVTGAVAGHRVQLAIECRNLRRPVTTQQIGDFAAKLNQLGMAPSQGLFVTTSSFTQDALDHARSLGMRALVFPDLTEDGLNVTVSEALQAIVFLLPEVVARYVVDGTEVPGDQIGDSFMLYDQNDFPHIFFHQEAWGREARVRGTGLTVWKLVKLTQEFDGDASAAAAHLEIDLGVLDEALRFAVRHPREVENAERGREWPSLERMKATLRHLEVFESHSVDEQE